MLKFFRLYLILMVPLPLLGQWTTSQTGNNAILESVHAFDQNNWYIGGNNLILRSTNAGSTWTGSPIVADGIPLLSSSVTELHFSTATTGIAVGYFFLGNEEYILRTTNGSQSWTIEHQNASPPYPHFINDLFFQPNQTDGWAVGANGRVLRTQNGGNDWSPVNVGVAWELLSVCFSNAQKGFIGGAGGLRRSNDGGQTWVSTPIQELVTSIQFLNAQTGFIGGYDMLKKTTDGGQTWVDVPLPLDGAAIEDLWFATDQFGYLLQYNTIFRTTDGGQVWETYSGGITTNTEYNGFDWFDADHGMIVGDQGLCLKTENGGLGQWAPIASFQPGPGFTTCANIPQSFENRTADVPTYTYQWFLDGNLVSTVRNPSVTFTMAGTNYQLMLVVTNGMATDSVTWTTTTNPPLVVAQPSLTATTNQVCKGLEFKLSVSPYLDWNTNWQLLANGVVIESGLFGYVERWLTPLETTVYTIRGTATDACTTVTNEADTTIFATQMPLYSAVLAVPEQSLVCEGDSTVVIIENSILGALYQWTGGISGQIFGTGGTLTIPTGPIGFNAIYDFTVMNETCYRYFPSVCEVKSEIVFTSQHSQFYKEVAGQPITIYNSSYGSSFSWDFGSNAQPTTSTDLYPTVVFPEPGIYPIRLIAANTLGCFDTSYTIIETFPENFLPTEAYAICASEPTGMQFVNHYLIDNILDTYIDNSGNTYVTGYRYEPNMGFAWWPTYNLFYNKYDANGQVVWSRYWPSSSHGFNFSDYYQCVGSSIAADTEGNVYLGGSFSGRQMVVNGDTVFADANPGACNGFVIKLNPDGNLLWSSRYLGVGGYSAVAPTELFMENNNRLAVMMSGSFFKIESPTQTITDLVPNTVLYGLHLDASGNIQQYVPIGTHTYTNGYISELDANYNPDPSALIGNRITRISPRMIRQPNGDWVLSSFLKGKILWDGIVTEATRPFGMNAFALRLDSDFKVKSAFTTFSSDDVYMTGTGTPVGLINLPFTTDSIGNIYQSVSLGGSAHTWEPPGLTPFSPISIYLGDSVPIYGDRCHFLLKYSPDGQLLWAVRSGNAYFSHIVSQPDGSIFGMVNYGHVLGLNTRSGQKYGKKGIGQVNLALVHWSPEGEITGVIDLATALFDNGHWLSKTPDGKLVALYSQGGNFLLGDTTDIRLSIIDPRGLCPSIPLSIIDQPENADFCEGNSPNFAVNAIGTSITYQWQRLAGSIWENLPDSSPYLGVQTSVLGLDAANAPTLINEQYRCILLDSEGHQDTTDTVQPLLLEKPEISLQPQSVSVAQNEPAMLLTDSPSPGVGYQWQYNQGNGWVNAQNGLFFQNVQGASLFVITIDNPNIDGTKLRCCLTSPTTGCKNYTSEATINIVVDTDDLSSMDQPTLNIFPNPATNQLWIQWEHIKGDPVNIMVKDMLGRVVYSEQVNASSTGFWPIEVQSWMSGIYEIQFCHSTNTCLSSRFAVAK